MFETTGTIDATMLKEVQKHLLAPSQKVLLAVFTLGCGGCAAIGLCTGDVMLLVLGLLGAIVFVAEGLWLKQRAIKRMMARTIETVGQPYMVYTSSFLAEGIQVQNHSNHAQAVLKYEVFCSMVQTPHLYLLFTKAWQFVPVFQEDLAPGAAQELVAFLKSQPTRIKWKKR